MNFVINHGDFNVWLYENLTYRNLNTAQNLLTIEFFFIIYLLNYGLYISGHIETWGEMQLPCHLLRTGHVVTEFPE